LTEAMAKLGPCQVQSRTESPCLRSADVEILGVAFCGPCAREQEAYFAIGELTHEEEEDFRGEALAEALERMRRVRVGSTGEVAGGIYHGSCGIDNGKPLVLRSG
jgi:hypothetical protein